jgi:broad specificity phosphatase PhoE
MQRVIHFCRHSKTAEPTGTTISENIRNPLTAEGFRLAHLAQNAFAPDQFDLAITSGTVRTDSTGGILVTRQTKLIDFVTCRGLFLPTESERATAIFGLYGKAQTATQAFAEKALRRHVENRMLPVLLGLIQMYHSRATLVVNHDGLIQMMIALMGDGRCDDVLNVNMNHCDAIEVTTDGASTIEEIAYRLIPAPSFAQ